MNDPRYALEDFHPDLELPLRPYVVTAEEIIDFATAFDPQPMHLDEEAGNRSILGGLSASGMHVAAMSMRMMCDSYILDSTSQGAPGVDFCKWKRPVLAGDTLSGRTIVKTVRRSKSRPNMGFVEVEHEIVNQRGELVCHMANTGMFLARAPEVAA